MYHSGVSPFGGWRHHLSPASGGTIKLRKAIFFIKWLYAKHGLFCSRLRGKSRAAGKGGGERSEPFTRMLIMLYDAKSQSRNADFILIAR